MLKRRTTLKLGLAGLSGGLMQVPLTAFGSANQKLLPGALTVIHNSDYPESRSFAESLVPDSFPILDTKDDLARLWYGQLREQLSHQSGMLFGLTDRLDLFCLEELARDVGMKVSFRIDHVQTVEGSFVHQAPGHPRYNEFMKSLRRQPDFARQIAGLAGLLPLPDQKDTSIQKRSGPFSPKGQTALVTWVIS